MTFWNTSESKLFIYRVVSNFCLFSTRKYLNDFRPRDDPKYNVQGPARSAATPQQPVAGGATPAWSPSHHSDTPAWDPGSRTPFSYPPRSPTPVAGSSWFPSASTNAWDTTYAALYPVQRNSEATSGAGILGTGTSAVDHPLLHPELAQVKVKAKMTDTVPGSKEKGLTVWSSLVAGKGMRLFHSKNGKESEVPANIVSIVYPDVMRTDGLLVVIGAEHRGTFVRRVVGKHVQGGDSLAVCRVVERVAGAGDRVTATRLELTAKDLACVVETPEEKKGSKKIFTTIRGGYVFLILPI